jgi:hypothetical protein
MELMAVLHTPSLLDIRFYLVVKMLFVFWLPGQKYKISPKVNKLPSTEGII